MIGEIYLLSQSNEYIKIIPINIIFNKIPYLEKGGKIKTFEVININNSFGIYNKIPLLNNSINIIVQVEQKNTIGEKYKNIDFLNIEYYYNNTAHKEINWEDILIS